MRPGSGLILGFSLVLSAAIVSADEPPRPGSETNTVEGGDTGSLRISHEAPGSKTFTLQVERLSDGMTKITWDKSWITCRRFKILMRNGRPETIDLLGEVKVELAPQTGSKHGPFFISGERMQFQFLNDRSEQMKIKASVGQP
jgi:hypothetical protein